MSPLRQGLGRRESAARLRWRQRLGWNRWRSRPLVLLSEELADGGSQTLAHPFDGGVLVASHPVRAHLGGPDQLPDVKETARVFHHVLDRLGSSHRPGRGEPTGATGHKATSPHVREEDRGWRATGRSYSFCSPPTEARTSLQCWAM